MLGQETRLKLTRKYQRRQKQLKMKMKGLVKRRKLKLGQISQMKQGKINQVRKGKMNQMRQREISQMRQG